jgi:hypothetical protein
MLKINPNHSLEFNRQANFFKDPNHLDIILNALRKAGVPELPSHKGKN